METPKNNASLSNSIALFEPLTVRGVTFKNRIAVSPMCQYSSLDGAATDWHLVHLGSRAVGGASLVMVEATAVEARGRISPEDMGIWDDKHIEPLERIASFISAQKAIAGIQLAHAGRKACTQRPWAGGGPLIGAGSWRPVAPSPIAFDSAFPLPLELSESDIHSIAAAFCAAAERAISAGFQVIELHAAHGYLFNEFLSPLSNQRTDQFGGSLENRMRFPLMVAAQVRAIMPLDLPLFVRISATDYADHGGWDLNQSIEFSKQLKAIGVDLVDCSSGGNLPHVQIPLAPGYQVGFADAIKHQAGILSSAVGLITQPEQANGIVAQGKADLIFLARELLRDPYWPLHAAKTLGADVRWPEQYLRAKN